MTSNVTLMSTEKSEWVDLEASVVCLGGWFRLPSGKVICHISTTKYHSDRKETCSNLGGYLIELHTRDDFNAYQEWMYNLRYYHSKSSGWVATGGEVFTDAMTNQSSKLQWGHSRMPVDTSNGGLFKPPSNEYTWNAISADNYLFLELKNYVSGGYLKNRKVIF